MSRTELHEVAVHEAGHALLGLVCGAVVEAFAVSPSGYGITRVMAPTPAGRALVSLGGWVAESIVFEHADRWAEFSPLNARNRDVQNARMHASFALFADAPTAGAPADEAIEALCSRAWDAARTFLERPDVRPLLDEIAAYATEHLVGDPKNPPPLDARAAQFFESITARLPRLTNNSDKTLTQCQNHAKRKPQMHVSEVRSRLTALGVHATRLSELAPQLAARPGALEAVERMPPIALVALRSPWSEVDEGIRRAAADDALTARYSTRSHVVHANTYAPTNIVSQAEADAVQEQFVADLAKAARLTGLRGVSADEVHAEHTRLAALDARTPAEVAADRRDEKYAAMAGVSLSTFRAAHERMSALEGAEAGVRTPLEILNSAAGARDEGDDDDDDDGDITPAEEQAFRLARRLNPGVSKAAFVTAHRALLAADRNQGGGVNLTQAAAAAVEQQRRDREAQQPAPASMLMGELREQAAADRARRLQAEARMQLLERSRLAEIERLRAQHAAEVAELDRVARARVEGSENLLSATIGERNQARAERDEHRQALVEARQALVAAEQRIASLESQLAAEKGSADVMATALGAKKPRATS